MLWGRLGRDLTLWGAWRVWLWLDLMFVEVLVSRVNGSVLHGVENSGCQSSGA